MPPLFFPSLYVIIGFWIVFSVLSRINSLIQRQIEQQIQEEVEQAGGSIIEIKKLNGLGSEHIYTVEGQFIGLGATNEEFVWTKIKPNASTPTQQNKLF